MDEIWWNKIPNASLFIKNITSSLLERKSVILQLSDHTPWYSKMEELIENALTSENAIGTCKRIEYESDDPGIMLFRSYCKDELKATYRPAISYARFLAEHEEIDLHDDIIWVNINSDNQLITWISFVEQYYSHLPKTNRRCRFILETKSQNPIAEKKDIKIFSYNDSIEHYDNVLFNLLAASSIPGNELYKRYLAEVVSLLFPNDPEFSAQCIKRGKYFLNDIDSSVNQIINDEIRSNGNTFETPFTPDEQNERIWEAQIKILFPLIERYRNILVKKYMVQIGSALPITTNYGETISSAEDVELGTIISLHANRKIDLSIEDYKKADKYKDARNSLAHFSPMSQQEVNYLIR